MAAFVFPFFSLSPDVASDALPVLLSLDLLDGRTVHLRRKVVLDILAELDDIHYQIKAEL